MKGRRSRFIKSESIIKAYFKSSKKRVFSESELAGILNENRIEWQLPFSMTTEKFIQNLMEREILIVKELSFEGATGEKTRFATSTASIFEIATSLVSKSYLSHFTAVFLHGLTKQVPKTIYISFEQSKKQSTPQSLTQQSIDQAFTKPQRTSKNYTTFEGYKLLIHNSMFTNRTGITTMDNIAVTNLERTLIDICVRPSYAGGVDSVLEAFRESIPNISINKLIATLNNLNFIYPYHQAIGFYLEKSGLPKEKIDKFDIFEKPYKFYLTYEMQEMQFSEKWNLYYPKGM